MHEGTKKKPISAFLFIKSSVGIVSIFSNSQRMDLTHIWIKVTSLLAYLIEIILNCPLRLWSINWPVILKRLNQKIQKFGIGNPTFCRISYKEILIIAESHDNQMNNLGISTNWWVSNLWISENSWKNHMHVILSPNYPYSASNSCMKFNWLVIANQPIFWNSLIFLVNFQIFWIFPVLPLFQVEWQPWIIWCKM